LPSTPTETGTFVRFDRSCATVEIPRLQALLDARGIALDREHRGAGHRRRERLRAAHPAEPGGENPLPREIAAVMPAAHLGKRLVRPLHDPLRADVDPRASRHLAVHHQPFAVELVEMLPRRPMRDEVRVRQHDARRVGMRVKDPDRFPRLDRQRLVVAEPLELAHDRVERLPIARRFPDPAVDDQIVRPFRNIGIEVVHQHPQRRFGLPALCAQGAAARRADRPCDLLNHSDVLRATTPGPDAAAPLAAC